MPTTAAQTRLEGPDRPQLLAPLWHTWTLLILLLSFALLSVWQTTHGVLGFGFHLANSHQSWSKITRLYVSTIGFEGLLLAFVAFGVQGNGGSLAKVFGPWKGWKELLLGLPLWLVLTLTNALIAKGLFHVGSNPTLSAMAPHSNLELTFWVALSITAGFSEEIISRGYLQKQFKVLCNSAGIAVLLQAVIFGCLHLYQGWRNAIALTVFGLLLGLVAEWRKTLWAPVIAHSWNDAVSGILLRLMVH